MQAPRQPQRDQDILLGVLCFHEMDGTVLGMAQSTGKKKWTEPAVGWGLRVGGPLPYIGYCFWNSGHRAKDECSGEGQRAVRVAMVPLAAARKAGLLRRPR